MFLKTKLTSNVPVPYTVIIMAIWRCVHIPLTDMKVPAATDRHQRQTTEACLYTYNRINSKSLSYFSIYTVYIIVMYGEWI